MEKEEQPFRNLDLLGLFVSWLIQGYIEALLTIFASNYIMSWLKNTTLKDYQSQKITSFSYRFLTPYTSKILQLFITVTYLQTKWAFLQCYELVQLLFKLIEPHNPRKDSRRHIGTLVQFPAPNWRPICPRQ